MSRTERMIRSIFASVVYFEKHNIPLYKSLREYIASFYSYSEKEIPLIFLSKDAYEKLISTEIKLYEPDVTVTIEEEGKYLWIKVQSEYPSITCFSVYVIQKEEQGLYTIRGYIASDGHCFAPNDIDKERFKSFIGETCVGYYYQNTKFEYPLYIG